MVEKSRTYQETHDWINFRFKPDNLGSQTWRLLGVAQAKGEQISGIPLLPNVAHEMHQVFLAKGVLATTAIEGNTLTESEVMRLIEGELELPPSKEYLATEIENILAASNWIADQLLGDAPTELNPDDIKKYNEMVLKGLPLSDEVVPGEYRHHDVRVASYKGAPPEDLAFLIGSLCDWLNAWNVPKQLETVLGILKAIVAHVYIAWIHPFADGNGRTARLIELQLLLAVGFPTPAAHLLSNHYNQTRTEYYRFLDMSSKIEGGIYYFIDYALQGFIDNLNEQIRLIERQQLSVHWQSYVHAHFRNKDSKTDIRRRRLVLDLSEKDKSVTLPELRHISPRIAEAYAGKTDKTVQRDINFLIQMHLVVKTTNGYRANRRIMRAFLPQKRRQKK